MSTQWDSEGNAHATLVVGRAPLSDRGARFLVADQLLSDRFRRQAALLRAGDPVGAGDADCLRAPHWRADRPALAAHHRAVVEPAAARRCAVVAGARRG